MTPDGYCRARNGPVIPPAGCPIILPRQATSSSQTVAGDLEKAKRRGRRLLRDQLSTGGPTV